MPAGTIGSTTEYGILGGFGIKGGIDPNDGVETLTPGELLVTYMSLHKVAKGINCEAKKITGSITSMIGGHAGSPEGATVAQIAAGLLTHIVYQTTISSVSLYDARYGGASGREAQWAVSVILQAFSRNTHVLKYSLANQVAGPCTEMLLYESVVPMMNASASGATEATFPRSGGGKYTDWLTPVECKFCAEVLKKSAGMSRKKVNEIAKVVIPKYEDMLMNPPKGKGTRECYDLEAFKPTQEWLDIYLKVKKEIIELGVPLEYP
jgi:methylamine--corrinoid protein Co-methyltransferase